MQFSGRSFVEQNFQIGGQETLTMPNDVSRDQFALIRIEGMHCHRCEVAITKALMNFVGIHEVEVDFASGQASVLYNPRIATVSQMMEAVNEAGYVATGFSQGEDKP
jgi:Cu+-exporting ATPase